jgi:hypothetical protein
LSHFNELIPKIPSVFLPISALSDLLGGIPFKKLAFKNNNSK